MSSQITPSASTSSSSSLTTSALIKSPKFRRGTTAGAVGINSSSLTSTMTTKSANIMLCPMMMTGNYSWTENTLQSSSSTGLQQQQPPPPMTPSHDTLIRMDTPNDEDKIDLKHISMALMKLLYPKTNRQKVTVKK
ncbi:hypothetical protein DERF_013561 [Dermatophagoides farinae]|uniref:Uncharacterized protein n=1 Tax=Dermatophagoides farinae TaxID=6954 RepID=A0A922HRF0_DERFA|nr:hypothetical protein DERF_013561 [Dermatophagoides farinae]